MEEYIAGKHSVTEALRSGRTIHKVWIADNAQKHLTQPIIAEAKKAGVIVQTADKRKLDQMAEGVQHQGVVAQVAAYGYVEVDDILARAEAKGRRRSFWSSTRSRIRIISDRFCGPQTVRECTASSFRSAVPLA